MITDTKTNFVYFSSLLKSDEKYLPLWKRLKPILKTEQIKHGFIENTRDIWCRDFMPVHLEDNSFVEFRFFPDYYIHPDYIHLLTIQHELKYDITIMPKKSKLIIDGGNIVRSKDFVILTDKIYKENSYFRKSGVINKLERDLGVKSIHRLLLIMENRVHYIIISEYEL